MAQAAVRSLVKVQVKFIYKELLSFIIIKIELGMFFNKGFVQFKTQTSLGEKDHPWKKKQLLNIN